MAMGYYPGGPADFIKNATGLSSFSFIPLDPVMAVHMPDGEIIYRFSDKRRWDQRRTAFGSEALPFWQWQEKTADMLWDLVLRSPPWPPQDLADLLQLGRTGARWLHSQQGNGLSFSLLSDAFRPIGSHLNKSQSKLHHFIDAQLLISAQSSSAKTNALYGSAALDLPRRGAVYPLRGMGNLAERLAQAVRDSQGQIHFRQEVQRILFANGRPCAVETKSGKRFPADLIIANLTPWNLRQLLPQEMDTRLGRLPRRPNDGWGAFVVYLGVDASIIPPDCPLHHQIITGEALTEGKSLFLSISHESDPSRAPADRRAITISTHTNYQPWWTLAENEPAAYRTRRAAYTDQVLAATNLVFPGLREASDLILPGTPITFQRYTRRAWGWVGGFPQTHLLRTLGARILPDLWMVGDSIFPGQSTTAVALSGLRVAKAVLSTLQNGPDNFSIPFWD
jgi:phytoene dehydrogenase-like protein